MGQPIQFIITGDVLINNLLTTIEDAASRFHDVTSWDDDDYGGSESPKSRIDTEAHRVADEIEKLRAELTALRAKVAAGEVLREAIRCGYSRSRAGGVMSDDKTEAVLPKLLAEAEAGRKLREAIRCGYCVDDMDKCAACRALAEYDAAVGVL